MGNYGIEAEDLKIDQNYRSYVLQSVHRLEQQSVKDEFGVSGTDAWIACEPADVFVVCDLWHNDGLNSNNPIPIGMFYSDDSRRAFFSFAPHNEGARAAITVYKFTLAHRSGDQYGIEVYNEQGEVVFNSSEKPLRIIDSIRLGGTHTQSRFYGKKVGILMPCSVTIPGQNFSVYQVVEQRLKMGNYDFVEQACYTETEIDGEYFGNSSPSVPWTDGYPNLIVADLSEL